MEYHTSYLDRQFGDGRVGPSSVLVLGGPADLSEVACHADPTLPCAGIFLFGEVSAEELRAACDALPDPAVPIADFGHNHGVRHDFEAEVPDKATIEAARRHFAPIMHRLQEIPFRALREERAELLILRLAYSRNCSIAGCFASSLPTVVQYRLLGSDTPKRAELERLAFLDLLRRRHFIRTHACNRCGSHRLLAFEACHACGSSDLVDEAIVHHYRCGCQEPEASFLYGITLVCPKCRRQLQHFGVDYDKPGMIVHCRGCGAQSQDPDPRFICLDCEAAMGGHQALPSDWYHYDLTDAGVLALRNGHLPRSTDHSGLTDRQCTRSMREFQLLAAAGLRNANKFSRPFTLARLTPVDFGSLAGEPGAGRRDWALQQAGATMAAALSETEFVAVGHDALLVGLPETGAAEAKALLDQARAAMHANSTHDLEFTLSVCGGNEAARLLSQY